MGEGKFSGIICPLPKVLCGYQLFQDVQYGIGPVVQISKMFEVSFISLCYQRTFFLVYDVTNFLRSFIFHES